GLSRARSRLNWQLGWLRTRAIRLNIRRLTGGKMMTDIVDQLRGTEPCNDLVAMRNEAAAEIGRLREAVAEARDVVTRCKGGLDFVLWRLDVLVGVIKRPTPIEPQ